MASDRELGMHRPITRRDFLEGSLAVSAGLVAAGTALGAPSAPRESASTRPNPPARPGLRGSHDGAFEVAHEMGLAGRRDWGGATMPDPADYDLVVVGAGISGLAAAHFYRAEHPDASVLILDNHDDFGGHARRNEFTVAGKTVLGYGGSQSLEAPSNYSDTALGLLTSLGVDLEHLAAEYDHSFYERHGLASSIYFDRETYGTDKVVRSQFIDASLFLPLADSGVPAAQAVASMPLPRAAKAQLTALFSADEDKLPDHSLFAEPGMLASLSYERFLTEYLGVTEPALLNLLRDMPASYFGHGADMIPALFALGFGLPGLAGTSLGSFEGLLRRLVSWTTEPYVYHFPDGNATIARLLVRQLIPGIAAGRTADDVVTAAFDYGRLDHPDNSVRLRLSSTAVHVAHDGDARSATGVDVTYVRDGVTSRVRGKRVVLACYNMAIPHLCPELPDTQKAALSQLVKSPLVYTNVLLRNWRAFKELGIGLAYSPGHWHKLAMLDFPVSVPGYRFTRGPDDPVILHMNRSVAGPGETPEAQSKAGRYELLGRSFETFERDIRRQLAGMLGSAGFDPAEDITGITVNRWPHGYAWSPNPLFGQQYEPGDAPNEIGRRPHGRITIANSDAGARAYLDCAIDEAFRAVGELPG